MAESKGADTAKELTAQVTKLESKARIHNEHQKSVSRTLDIVRRLAQVATGVVLALLVVLWFVDHPMLTSKAKQPILGALFVISFAYAAALEIARGSDKVVIFLVTSGVGVSGFALGCAAVSLHRYLF